MSATKKLAGKVAVVTGASKGIGAEIARQLADAGAAVVVNYASSKSGADSVVDEITRSGGQAVAVQADLAKEADVSRLFAESKKAFGRLDILVNNAGIYEFAPIEAVTAEHFHKQFNLNVLGLILATQDAVKAVRSGRRQHHQHQFGVSPRRGFQTRRSTARRRGRWMPRRDRWRRNWARRKIRVNSINPGMVETEGMHAAGFAESDFRKQVESQTPLGRIGQPRDIAPVVVYLASDDSSWVTGETFNISGGNR